MGAARGRSGVGFVAPTTRAGRARPGRSDPTFGRVIETEDGATIMLGWHGYGRAYPPGRRQIVGAVFHRSDHERYKQLNDAVCVSVGEVRRPADPNQAEPDLVVDIAELVWEPIDE